MIHWRHNWYIDDGGRLNELLEYKTKSLQELYQKYKTMQHLQQTRETILQAREYKNQIRVLEHNIKYLICKIRGKQHGTNGATCNIGDVYRCECGAFGVVEEHSSAGTIGVEGGSWNSVVTI